MANAFDQFDEPQKPSGNAFDQFDQPAAKQPQKEIPEWAKAAASGVEKIRSLGHGMQEVAGAVLEPIEKVATGAIAKPISEIAGLAATGYEAATGGKDAEKVPEFKKSVQEALTYEPKTAAGASQYNPLNLVPAAIGEAVGRGAEAAAKGVSRFLPGREEEGATPAGVASNLIKEGIPQAIGMAGLKAGPLASAPIKSTSNALRSGAQHLMASALKPTLRDLKSGAAATAIDTMLEKGYSPTSKGVEQIRLRIDDLNKQIKQEIANSPDKVSTARIARPVVDKLKEFRKQVNPDADVSQVKKSWDEFKNHPLISGTEIPVQLAQELKQGTYRQLSKKYGQAGTAEVEAQKSIARGLKEEVAKKVPKISALNAEETRLLKTLSVMERRVLLEANKNPMGLATLTHDPRAWAAFMADKSATFKSLLARVMNASADKMEGKFAEKAVPTVAMTAPEESDKRSKQFSLESGLNRP